ncbi:hypothetical protein EVAR_42448_1 [Eumeta japonica]|uniref:Uncharacterized protein n=1 Tax=Eumeta variegata TaxID=151549 RepID=A0A4C1Y1R7_EUMVA|nr:hypothetical protein EVAR_42448_1 [Eumeta japonica]
MECGNKEAPKERLISNGTTEVSHYSRLRQKLSPTGLATTLTMPSNEAPEKCEGRVVVNQLQGGEPRSDEPTRQSSRGSTYVKVTVNESNIYALLDSVGLV